MNHSRNDIGKYRQIHLRDQGVKGREVIQDTKPCGQCRWGISPLVNSVNDE